MPILLRILRFIIITIIDRLIVQKLSAPKTEVKPKLEDNSVLLSSLKQEYALSQKTFIAKHFWLLQLSNRRLRKCPGGYFSRSSAP